MLKVRNGNYYQQKLQNNYFQPKVLLLAQPLYGVPLQGDFQDQIRVWKYNFDIIAFNLIRDKWFK